MSINPAGKPGGKGVDTNIEATKPEGEKGSAEKTTARDTGGSSYTTGDSSKHSELGGKAIGSGVLLAKPGRAPKFMSLEEVAEATLRKDPMSWERGENIRIMRHAMDHVKEAFKPENLGKGKVPSDKRIAGLALSALRYGFKMSGGDTVSSNNSEIRKLIEPFTRYLTENAVELGLVGTKEPKKRAQKARDASGNVMPAKKIAAQRIFRAISMLDEIAGYTSQVPIHYIITFLEHNRLATPENLLQSAKNAAPALIGLGKSVEEIEGNLGGSKRIKELLKHVETIQDIRNEMRLMVVDSTIYPDYERADYFMGFINSDIDSWTRKYEGSVSPDLLKEGVRTYIAYWLAGTMGDTHERLTHQQRSFENAALIMERSIKSETDRKTFRGPFNRLVHFLVRLEAKRNRLDGSGDSRMQPPSNNAINGRKGLERVIGSDLLADLDAFYTKIRDDIEEKDDEAENLGTIEKQRRTAVEFFELFFHYIRYAANTYGDNLLPEIKKRGLEARLVHSIFNRVEDAHLYGDESLNLLRTFFIEHISKTSPSIEDLVPMHLQTATKPGSSQFGIDATTNDDGYIKYLDGMGMREFITQIPGITPEVKTDFYEKTGISWVSFLNWGSIRSNPEKLSETDWETIVDFAAEGDRRGGGGSKILTQLLMSNRPDKIERVNWKSAIEKAKSDGMLVALAKTHRPTNVSNSDWDKYVQNMKKSGRLENVTVEPRLGKALDAILSAYHFMRSIAQDSGSKIDLYEYIASIYPIARRLLSRSDDGSIRINIPEFMRDVEFRNWGYHRIAQKISESDDVSEFAKSTLTQHMLGKVDNPEYYIIRRYTTDLAESSGGGAAKEAELYDFIAGMLRWIHVLDGGMPVYDEDRNLLTNYTPTEIDTQHSFELYYDYADYNGKKSPLSRAEAETFLDVRRGLYRQQIDFIGDHISSLKALPGELQLLDPTGNEITISELEAQLHKIQQDDLLFNALLTDRSQTVALRSENDTKQIRDFYTGVRDFTERVTFLTRALGSMETSRETIHFQITPNISGHTIDRINGKYVTVMVDDIIDRSRIEGWSDERRDDAMQLRIILSYLEAINELGDEDKADLKTLTWVAGEYWKTDEVRLNRAVLDHMRMIEMNTTSHNPKLKDNITSKPSGGKITSRLYEPYLPHRRRTDGWREQFSEFAKSKGLKGRTISKGIKALEKYFETVKFFHRDFWPNTLRQIIDKISSDEGESEILYNAAVNFFPTISVVSKTREEREEGAMDSIVDELARRAVEDYVDLFPMEGMERTKVPIDRNLLNSIVSVHLDENMDMTPERSLVQRKTYQRLNLYNKGAKQVEWSSMNDDGLIELDGMLQKRLESTMKSWSSQHGGEPTPWIVRRAYFHLLPKIRDRKTVGLEDVESAIITATKERGLPSSIDTDFLLHFVSKQSDDIGSIVEIIADEKVGIANFAEKSYRSKYVDGDNLELLATAFSVRRLTENLPVDIRSISIDIVGRAFAPYADITDKMASFYRNTLENWLLSSEKTLANRIELFLMALEEAGADTDNPARTPDELISKSIALAEESSIESILSTERALKSISELIGKEDGGFESITDARDRIFRDEVSKSIATHEQHQEKLQKKLSAIVERGADIQRRSADFYMGIDSTPNIPGMDSNEAKNFIDTMEVSMGILFGLRDELETFTAGANEAIKIIEELGFDPALKVAESKGTELDLIAIMDSTEEKLDSVERSIERWHPIAEERAVEAKEEETLRIQEKIIGDALRRANALFERADAEVSAAKETISKIESMAGSREDITDVVDIAGKGFSEYRLARDEIAAFKLFTEKALSSLGARSKVIYSLSNELAVMAKEFEGLSKETDNSLDLKRSSDRVYKQLGQLNGLMSSIATTRADIKLMVESFVEQLERARNDMPISGAVGFPEHDFINDGEIIVDGHSFSEGEPRWGAHKKAQKTLDSLLHSVIINTESESRLISQNQYAAMIRRARIDEDGPTTFTDIFGNSIELLPDEVFSFAYPQSMQEDRPFQRLINNLAVSVSENDLSLSILLKLKKSSDMNTKVRELFNELLSVMASDTSISDPESAHALIQRWSLARREELVGALGVAVGHLFIDEYTKIDRLPPLVKLAQKLPESAMIEGEIVDKMREAGEIIRNAPTTDDPSLEIFLFMKDFPELEGAVILDIFTAETGKPITQRIRLYRDYKELVLYGGDIDRNLWIERFVEIHTEPSTIKDIRRPLGMKWTENLSALTFMRQMKAQLRNLDESIGRSLTGRENPEVSALPHLPSWDSSNISKLPIWYIEEQVSALGILKYDEQTLSAMMKSWKEETLRNIVRANKQNGVPSGKKASQKRMTDFPDAYMEMMLILQEVDPSGYLYDKYRRDSIEDMQRDLKSIAKLSTKKQMEYKVRFAYGFLLNHRETILPFTVNNAHAKDLDSTQLKPSYLGLAMPEAGRVKKSILAKFLAEYTNTRHEWANDDENLEYSSKELLDAIVIATADFKEIPEIIGALVIDSVLAMNSDQWGDVPSILMDYLRENPEDRKKQKDFWISKIVKAHSNPKFLAGTRKRLGEELLPGNEDHETIMRAYGGKPGMTIAELFTGSKTPWKDENDDDDGSGGGTPQGTPPVGAAGRSSGSSPAGDSGARMQGTISDAPRFANFFDGEEYYEMVEESAEWMFGNEESCIDPTLAPYESGEYYFTPSLLITPQITPASVGR